jgi:hypothetical protein
MVVTPKPPLVKIQAKAGLPKISIDGVEIFNTVNVELKWEASEGFPVVVIHMLAPNLEIEVETQEVKTVTI